jgi:sorting nexin-8
VKEKLLVETDVQIANLVSSRPRVSKLEFFVALALVALAQSGKGRFSILILVGITKYVAVLDVSIEQVAVLSSQNTLPEPKLDLTRLQPYIPTIVPATRKSNTSPLRASLPSYSSEDPWNSNSRFTGLPAADPLANGTPSAVAGSGLPKDWWKKQESIQVTLLGQQGFILNRYMVYEISSEVSCTSLGLRPSF